MKTLTDKWCDAFFRPNPLWNRLMGVAKEDIPKDETGWVIITMPPGLRDAEIATILEKWPKEDRQRLYEHLNAKGHRMK